MSGVGKSTALTELARRGYVTVDTDEGPWIQVFEGEPLWRGFSRLSPDTIAQVAVDEQHRRIADSAGARAAHTVAGVRLQDPIDAAARAGMLDRSV